MPESEKQSMNVLTTNPALARKRIARIESRLQRYPDHPAKDKMLEQRAGYQAAIEAAGQPAPPPDRLLNRLETLIGAIRKINAVLDAEPQHPNKKRMLERRVEYQTSLTNIQEYGRERMPTKMPVGTKIEVPADVLEQRSE